MTPFVYIIAYNNYKLCIFAYWLYRYV